ncbi:MAG: DUF167 domain-containing protein [Candidatus Thermochlorobacter sp.]
MASKSHREMPVKTLAVKVVPNAKKEGVIEENGRLKIYVHAPALDGKANKAVIEILSRHLGIKKSKVRIVRGETSREKVIEILALED